MGGKGIGAVRDIRGDIDRPGMIWNAESSVVILNLCFFDVGGNSLRHCEQGRGRGSALDCEAEDILVEVSDCLVMAFLGSGSRDVSKNCQPCFAGGRCFR
jgi:hypothetical protein